ncbi:hypothetical protein CEXT_490811 [Caerostris extrusa]|uniref:Uncharacterized protein n=1 Tax=Caerostris extrusa TaxID=172846 RepID=A0AAV4XKS4_CAEEX|nr:hypothetical protein CEXT_490811 [Caerostris extrusa]
MPLALGSNAYRGKYELKNTTLIRNQPATQMYLRHVFILLDGKSNAAISTSSSALELGLSNNKKSHEATLQE